MSQRAVGERWGPFLHQKRAATVRNEDELQTYMSGICFSFYLEQEWGGMGQDLHSCLEPTL